MVYNHVGPENHLGEFTKLYFNPGHKTDWGTGLNLVGTKGDPVREFIVENSCYWAAEYHVDGLRLDAIQAIDREADPYVVKEVVDEVRKVRSDKQFIVIAEDDLNDPRVLTKFGLDAVYADDFHHQLHVALTGEKSGYYEDYTGTVEDLAKTMRQCWWFTGQKSLWRSKRSGKSIKVGNYVPDQVSRRHFIWCLQNHDQIGNRPRGERFNHLVDPDSYRAASALLLLSLLYA